jgi:Aspartyl/Asparaginyl beta-hydroxylase
MATVANQRTWQRAWTTASRIAKLRLTQRVAVLVVAAFLVPYVVAFYLTCGLLDVIRNDLREPETFRKYFVGSGAITWLLSPLNLLLDLLSLPYWNRGVYKLEDLPEAPRVELESLLSTIEREHLVAKLEPLLEGHGREMLFFKWLRHDLETPLEIPVFHARYQYIATIGVSVFNQKRSTNWHFGPFRATLRVLYSLNRIESDASYIDVGRTRNYWRDNRLFIFDDTLLHRSVNETDERRYCAFIDIQRPTLAPWFMNGVISTFGAIFLRLKHVFYNAWTFIR